MQALDGSLGLSDLPGPWHMSFRAQRGSWGYKAPGVGVAWCSPLFLADPLLERGLGGGGSEGQSPAPRGHGHSLAPSALGIPVQTTHMVSSRLPKPKKHSKVPFFFSLY